MISERGHYKGNQIIILKKDVDDKYPFSFGLSKAKLILEHIKDIEEFVEDIEQNGQMQNNEVI